MPLRYFRRWGDKAAVLDVLTTVQLRMLNKSLWWIAVSPFNARCLKELGNQGVKYYYPAWRQRVAMATHGSAGDVEFRLRLRGAHSLIPFRREPHRRHCIASMMHADEPAAGSFHPRFSLPLCGNKREG